MEAAYVIEEIGTGHFIQRDKVASWNTDPSVGNARTFDTWPAAQRQSDTLNKWEKQRYEDAVGRGIINAQVQRTFRVREVSVSLKPI
jgi:hypothetical protein